MVEVIVVVCAMGIFACIGFMYYQWLVLKSLKRKLKQNRHIPIPDNERCNEEFLSDSIIIDLD